MCKDDIAMSEMAIAGMSTEAARRVSKRCAWEVYFGRGLMLTVGVDIFEMSTNKSVAELVKFGQA